MPLTENIVIDRLDSVPRQFFDEGPWDEEPDFMQWISPAGLTCRVVRNDVGTLCGYAGVRRGHPAYGHHHDSRLVDQVEAHGGVNFSGFQSGSGGIPESPLWWFGFDCAHAWDAMPFNVGRVVARQLFAVQGSHIVDEEQIKDLEQYLDHREALQASFNAFARRHVSYKDFDFVRVQAEFLAFQLAPRLSTDGKLLVWNLYRSRYGRPRRGRRHARWWS